MKSETRCLTVLTLLCGLAACGDSEAPKTPALDAETVPTPTPSPAPPAVLLQGVPEHGITPSAESGEDALQEGLQAQQTLLAQLQDAVTQNQVALDGLNAKLDQLIERLDTRNPAPAPATPTKGKVKTPLEPSTARQHAGKVPPFAVEAVDIWGGEQRIVINDGSARHDLKPGERYAGWTVVGAQDGRVTVRGEQGQKAVLDVQWK